MPDTPRLSLKALRAFVVAVEERSIAGAASRLAVAASAVSAALDQVEAEMGATLLVRTRAKGISATAEGREIADRFRVLLESYEATLDEGRSLTKGLSGTLRIGYYAPVAPAFLPTILGPLMADNPELGLELKEHDNDSAQDALLAGRLDVILFAGQDLRRGITIRHLLDLPPYVLAPEGHPIASKGSASLSSVAQHPIIQLDRPLARPYVDQLFQTAELDPRISARADSTEMVRSLVGARAGLAILAMRPLTNMSYGGHNLRCVPLSDDLPPLQLLSGHAARQPRRLVVSFLEALEGFMRSDNAQSLTVT